MQKHQNDFIDEMLKSETITTVCERMAFHS